MENGLWFVTILREQPWIAVLVVLVLAGLAFLAKQWVAKKLMADQPAGESADPPGGPSPSA